MDNMTIKQDMIPEMRFDEIHGSGDSVVGVVKHISYNAKQVMAFEMYLMTLTTDDENDLVYKSYKSELIETALIAKYYTNIDISDLDAQNGWPILHDWLVMNDLYDAVIEYIEKDLGIVKKIYQQMYDMSKYIHDETNSLPYKLMKAFDFMLNNKDIAQEIAATPDMNNMMMSMLDAYNKQNSSKPQNVGKVNAPSGVVLNMAKKKTNK